MFNAELLVILKYHRTIISIFHNKFSQNVSFSQQHESISLFETYFDFYRILIVVKYHFNYHIILITFLFKLYPEMLTTN